MEEKELFRHQDEIDPKRLQMILESRPVHQPAEVESPGGFKVHPQIVLLLLLLLMTLFAGVVFPGDPGYMALTEKNLPPGAMHLFGTDTLGRDVFGMVLHGGRVSLLVGLLSTIISTGLALIIGSSAALLPGFLSRLISRGIELFLSIPSILLMIFVQSVLSGNALFSISLSIGLSSWMTMAKMVSAKILEIRNEEYISLARYHGGGCFYLMRKHYLPDVIPVVSYMAFSSFGHAIGAEATLSFLGIGFPVGTVTWGSLLNLSGQALLSQSWWVILVPGIFLVVTVASLIETGEIIRRKNGLGIHL